MPMHKNPNIEMLEAVVERLGPLNDEVVFLGGGAAGLLLTDPAAPPLRITRDVDVILEVTSLAATISSMRNSGIAVLLEISALMRQSAAGCQITLFLTSCRQILNCSDSVIHGSHGPFRPPELFAYLQARKFGYCRRHFFWQRRWKLFIIAAQETSFSAGMLKT